jgi:hypothetical protein
MPQALLHKTKQYKITKENQKTSTILSLNKGNLEINHVQEVIKLGVPWSHLVGLVQLYCGDR